MYYPVFFLIPAFFFIGPNVFGTENIWVMWITLFSFMAAFGFKRPGLLALVLTANLAARVYFGESGLEVSATCFAIGWVLFAIFGYSLCPRCQTHISEDGWSRWRRFHIPKYCTVCGRARQGVWPLQFRLRPEPWDGQYHDEGGGPKPDLDITEWQMYYAQERWKKKIARQAEKASRHTP